MTLLRTALLATASATFALSAAASARPMTPEDVARLEYTGTVAVSPDGQMIAFTRVHFPDVTKGEENGGSRQQLFLADAAMQAKAWLPEDMRVTSPGFTPDGQMITFLWAKDKEKRAVYAVPVAGGAHRKIAEIKDANVLSYEISPDGRQIYLLAAPAPDKQRDDEKDAGFDAEIYEEELRFNRMFLANVMQAGVDAEPSAIAVPGFVDAFDIAPSGEWAVITSAPTPLVDDSFTKKRANILDLASLAVTTVETPGKIGDIEISPDSMVVSMIAAVDQHDPADTTLYLIDPATGLLSALNEGAPEAAVNAEWMADGRLAVQIDKGVTSFLRFYGPNGMMQNEVATGGLVLAGMEQGGNRLVLEANSAAHPNELYLYSSAGFERWTDHNPWLADIDLGTQRSFTFTARDGQLIEGIVIEPVGDAPLGGAPLILDVHGGPEAHDTNGWITNYGGPGQVAAGAGYAVALVNYRGSTGYGVDFSKQHQRDAAGKEFDDLVDAKYALAELGIADPARVGVTGGSYGGFATAWSSTYYSQQFAAGVMFVGLANLYSKFGTTDIATEDYLVHSRHYPWEDYTATLERSPVFHADKADTPLLILHGADDTRVSPTQSSELYRHIKIRRPDTPLRLVFYPDEGHGNAKAAARYDYNLRMMEWFDTYLKTGDRDAPLPGPRPDLKIEQE